MDFRYKHGSGKVVTLSDVTSLIHAIRDGLIRPDTPFAVGDDKYWHRAETVTAYREAAAVLRRLPAGHALLGNMAPPGLVAPVNTAQPKRRPVKLVLMAAVVALAAGLALMRPWEASEASAGSSAADRTATMMKEQLTELETTYGRSFARGIWRRQQWLRNQQVEERFQGAALKSPESLRGVHQISRAIRSGADSLVPAADLMARILGRQADSIEQAQKRLAGLGPALDDRLSTWREDVLAYTRMQYDLANTLDELAEFLLKHQQGFAIKNGRAFFMSRTDAGEFRELLDELTVHMNRERAWSDGLQERHHGWLTSIPVAERPVFGESVLTRRE
jgi:hypothetical protein